MSSVQLNVYGTHDDVTGTLVLTVHDPLGEVKPDPDGVKFYVTDGTGTRSAAQNFDRKPSPGVYEKDVRLDEKNETLIEPEVFLKDGSKRSPGAESFPRTSGMATTLVQGARTERGSSVELGARLTLGRTPDGRRPLVDVSGTGYALLKSDRLEVGPGVEAWMHNPYADGIGAPTAHISRLEVGAKPSLNSDQPAILRIHQAGSGAAELFKPKGTTLQLRETPGGNGGWFNHFLVNGASLRATGHIQSDSHLYAHWNSGGWRLRMGEIHGAAGLWTPDNEMRFDIGGTGPFRFSMGNAEKMSLYGNGWMDLQGGLWVSRNGTTGGGIVLADDGDIVDLNDGYCSMRFTNGVRIFSGNRGGGAVIALTSSGQVHANALYVNTSAGQIRTDLGNAGNLLFANTNRATTMWVGTGPTFETGPRIGFHGDSNTFRPGQVWFVIGGDANPAEPAIHVERRTPGAYSFRATLCDRDGNGRWVGSLSATAFNLTSSRETKEEITPFVDDALSLINRIGVVSFAYRADEAKRRRVGVVAEDTDPLFSGAERKHFDLANTLGVLIRAVQQLTGRMEGLEQRA
ncbi:MAG: tail fiber domain-containing protein [Gemmatimonadetes bacterium]|nr:tail fiber domain-containing protein [Gemmatimonadota bacterium]